MGGGGWRERKRERMEEERERNRCGKGFDTFIRVVEVSLLDMYYSQHGNQQNDKVRFFRVNGVGRIKLG